MYDLTIIGAGIVGLASAYQTLNLHPNLKVLIIEKENTVAYHQSSRNSGVLHTGIYYKPNSLKAKTCLQGYQLMLAFCDQYKIPYEICGKVIVATSKNELKNLDEIYKRGLENNIPNIRMLNKTELNKIEPFVNGIKAIHVPSAGIIDYKKIAKKLHELLELKGVEFRFNEKVVAINQKSNLVKIITQSNNYSTSKLLNCGGLFSDIIAKLGGQNLSSRVIPFRGEYFQLKHSAKHLVKNLVYPVPNPNFPFLGVHFTRRINGIIDAGPNAVLAFKREGYHLSDVQIKELWQSISYIGFRKLAAKYWRQGFGELYRSISKRAFTLALQKLIPKLTINDIEQAPSGVRAQAISRNGELIDDFQIIRDGVITHVINAPSPAATSSLSIGKHIASIIDL